MKTFNLNKHYEELSFNEILSILIVAVEEMEIIKFNKKGNLSYYVTLFVDAKDYEKSDKFGLSSIPFTWKISYENKNLDSLKKQDSNTKRQLDSFFEFAINLGLIELKY